MNSRMEEVGRLSLAFSLSLSLSLSLEARGMEVKATVARNPALRMSILCPNQRVVTI